MIRATQDYVGALQRAVDDPAIQSLPLRELMAPQIEAGWIRYFEPYEEIHRNNVAAVLAAAARLTGRLQRSAAGGHDAFKQVEQDAANDGEEMGL